MKKVETGIEGLLILEPLVHGDSRGFFMETYNARTFENLGLPTHWVQENYSRSQRGVLRGLHMQSPHAQQKLVRVTVGSVFDVAVDLRKDSKTFGRAFSLELSAENKRALYMPVGFAHGFCVTSEVAEFQYLVSDFYSPKDEQGIIWNDPDLGIAWPIKEPLLSEKDRKFGKLRDWKI